MFETLRHVWAFYKVTMRHKLYVFQAGRRIGVPLWQLIIHDWSKFLPSECVAYGRSFYGKRTPEVKDDFDYAWNSHQKRNKHHWQYWVLLTDTTQFEPLPMPSNYADEMVADWLGAGRAYNGEFPANYRDWRWFHANWPRISRYMHIDTKRRVGAAMVKYFGEPGIYSDIRFRGY